jgi:hypothetical protein
VTIGQPESNQEQHVDVTPKPASLGKRVSEWFWRGVPAEKARLLPELSARAIALAQRARNSADLAQSSTEVAQSAELDNSAVAPGDPIENSAEPNTSELYRQSVYWASCALASRSDENAGTSYDQAIWDTLDEQLLVAAAPDRALQLRNSLRSGSFVYFAELPAAEQKVLSVELRKLSELLLAKVNERSLALHAVFWQRVGRFSLLLLLLLAIVGGAVWERNTREGRRDLAEGKPWRASSMFQPGCVSPAQVCSESPTLFFHTIEEKDPWIEFDLGTVQEVSGVRADNRTDCCADRAIPLVVEVSENHKRWRTVARQDVEFTSWRATFGPVKARWVRLKAHKVTYLHLSRVRILP